MLWMEEHFLSIINKYNQHKKVTESQQRRGRLLEEGLPGLVTSGFGAT